MPFRLAPIFLLACVCASAADKAADAALTAGPYSVMHKKLTPDSGDKHDYMSVGPYWWPDPSKPDGLPYIRRDGEINPARNDDQTDSRELHDLFGSVKTLGIAYRETKQEKYAEHAALLLRTWFLDPATRMNPNLNFGQAVPGRVKGRGTGIIDTAGLGDLVKVLGVLANSKHWKTADNDGMKAWMKAYTDWLLTSDIGKDEGAAKNNHGSWYDVQVASMALFTGRKDLAQRVLEEAKTKRIAAQIEPDGSMPLELARTKAFSYSTMNLRAMFELAALGEQAGVDLWHFQTADGRSLRKALDFLAAYADPAMKWPNAQIDGGVKASNRKELAALLEHAAVVYHEASYGKLAKPYGRLREY